MPRDVKKLILECLLLALTLSATLTILIRSFPTSVFGVPSSSFQTFQDKRFGIMLLFPSDWKKSEDFSGAWFRNANESVNVRVQASPYSGMLNQFVKTQENLTSQQFPGRVALESQETKIGMNHTAFVFVFEYQEVPYDPSFKSKIKEMQLYTIDDHMAYVLSYFTSAKEYGDYLPIVHDIVNSIRINQTHAE